MIEIKQMRAGYHGKTIVDVRDLAVHPGQITVIVGKNGSGKSTLLRAAAGLIPHEGQILIGGREVNEMSGRELAGERSFLSQHLPVPDMTVRTLVYHGRFCRMGFSKTPGKEDRRIAAEAMRTARVDALQDRMIGELSGGERQRAYIAMIIAQDAGMILLDEPDTFMDAPHKKELLRIIRGLRSRGRGLMMTSHDLPFAFLAADRICVLDKGEITADADASGLDVLNPALQKAMGLAMCRTREEGFWYPYMMTEPS